MNVFDQFDTGGPSQSGNPFDQFDETRQTPKGAMQNLAAPIANLPSTYSDMVRQSVEQMKTGAGRVGTGAGEIWQGDYGQGAKDIALGAGGAALGAAGYASAPINAPVHAFIGEPVKENVEAATGSPKAGEFAGNLADIAATFALPVPEKVPVGVASTNDIGWASEHLGVPIPRAAATESIPVKSVSGGLAQVPIVGTPLVKASKEAISGLDKAARAVAASYGEPERFAAGTSAKQGIVNWVTDKSKAISGRLYDNVDRLVNPEYSGPLTQTRKTIDAITKERESAYLPRGKAVETVSGAVVPKEPPMRGIDENAPLSLGPNVREIHSATDNRNVPSDLLDISAPKRTARPQNLVEFIKMRGGIRDPGGDLTSMGLNRDYPGLIRKKGMFPDLAREAAAEAGYLGADVDRAMGKTTINDLHEALGNGHNVYSVHDADQLAKYEDYQTHIEGKRQYGSAKNSIMDYVEKNGGSPLGEKILSEAARLMVDEGRNIEDAIESSSITAETSRPIPSQSIKQMNQEFDAMINGIKNSPSPPKLTYEGLKKLRTHVGELADSGILPEGMSKGDLKRVYGALSQDLRDHVAGAGGKPALEAFNKANRVHEQISRRRETLAKIVGEGAEAAPEQVLNRLISMAAAVRGADLAKLSQARKAIGAEGWNDVAAAAVDKLGRQSPGADFSGDRFITEWGNLSPAGKKLLFDSTEKSDLSRSLDAINIASKAHRSLAQFGNPSGTGRAGGLLAMAGALWANPLAALSGAIGGNAMARVLASPVAAKSTSKWIAALNKVGETPSPARVAVLVGATRNLMNNLADLGVPASALRSLAGQVPAQANEPDNGEVPSVRGHQPYGGQQQDHAHPGVNYLTVHPQ